MTRTAAAVAVLGAVTAAGQVVRAVADLLPFRLVALHHALKDGL